MPELRETLQVLNFFRSVGEARERREETRKRAAWEQTKFLIEQQRKRNEFTVSKWSSLLDKLSEGPSKDLVRTRIKDWAGSLSPEAQRALAPRMEKLFPPEVEKAAEFDRIYGKPIDPSAIDPNEDPVSRAKLQFANDDLVGRKGEFVSGIKYEPTNISYITENMWAWRDDEGRMGVLSREGTTGQEWIQKTLDKAKMTWDMAMVQGGEVPQGAAKTITDGRMRYELTPTLNILNGRTGFKRVPVGRVIRAGQRELPQVLSDFSTSFTLGDGVTVWESIKGGAPEGAALYDQVQEALDALEEVEFKGEMVPYSKLGIEDQTRVIKRVIRGALGTHIAGWNIEVHNPGVFKGTVYNRFAQSKYGNIYFIPGVVQPFFNTREELVGAFYWDSDYDVVRDQFNQVKGTKAELDAMASGLDKGDWLPKEER